MKGFGKLNSPNEVAVDLAAGGTQTLQTDNIIIATGSEPTSIPGVKVWRVVFTILNAFSGVVVHSGDICIFILVS